MLESHLGVRDLAFVRGAPELPHELGALGEAGRAEGMSLREEAAGGVRDPLAAVGVVAFLDELLGAALVAEAERLVRQDLVRGEAVVQLDDLDVLGAEARLVVDLLRARLRMS